MSSTDRLTARQTTPAQQTSSQRPSQSTGFISKIKSFYHKTVAKARRASNSVSPRQMHQATPQTRLHSAQPAAAPAPRSATRSKPDSEQGDVVSSQTAKYTPLEIKNLLVKLSQPSFTTKDDQALHVAFDRMRTIKPMFLNNTMSLDDLKNLAQNLNSRASLTEKKPIQVTTTQRTEMLRLIPRRIEAIMKQNNLDEATQKLLADLIVAAQENVISLTQADQFLTDLEGDRLTDVPAELLKKLILPKLESIDILALAKANKGLGNKLLTGLNETEARAFSDANIQFTVNAASGEKNYTINPKVPAQKANPEDLMALFGQITLSRPSESHPELDQPMLQALQILAERADTPSDLLEHIIKQCVKLEINSISGRDNVMSIDQSQVESNSRDFRQQIERLIYKIAAHENASISTLLKCARISGKLHASPAAQEINTQLSKNPVMIKYATRKTNEYLQANPTLPIAATVHAEAPFLIDILPIIEKSNVSLARKLKETIIVPLILGEIHQS